MLTITKCTFNTKFLGFVCFMMILLSVIKISSLISSALLRLPYQINHIHDHIHSFLCITSLHLITIKSNFKTITNFLIFRETFLSWNRIEKSIQLLKKYRKFEKVLSYAETIFWHFVEEKIRNELVRKIHHFEVTKNSSVIVTQSKCKQLTYKSCIASLYNKVKLL